MNLTSKNVFTLLRFFQITLIFLFLFPINTSSAELLQINDFKTILVGDQNRSLDLSLYCIDINKNEADLAIEILKKNFPRGTKVKIKPYGYSDNKLLAKIYKIDDDIEMTDLLSNFNSTNNCVD